MTQARRATCLALLLAAPARAIDLVSPRAAAVDQPQINVALSRPGSPNVALAGDDPFGGESIVFGAFYDTGASGIVLGPQLADTLGLSLQQQNGTPVVFSDVSPGGFVDYNVSEPVHFNMADSLGYLDNSAIRSQLLSEPGLFPNNLFNTRTMPLRSQVGPTTSGGGLSSEINVVGTPAMSGRTMVMNPAPTNGYLDFYVAVLNGEPITDDDLDVFMRTANRSNAPVPLQQQTAGNPPRQPDHAIATTLVDFSRYTRITPGATPPAQSTNPMIGPSPIDGTGDAPGVQIGLNGSVSEGSWLFDTGAAASFVSSQTAADLGVSYADGAGPGSDAPRLDGVPLDRQFTLTISGISGNAVEIAGFYADDLLLRSTDGDVNNPNDPAHVRFGGAPVLILDIELADPDAGETIILDGILGMNYFVASADFEILPGEFLPIITDFAEAPFEELTYNGDTGLIGLNRFADGLPMEQPSGDLDQEAATARLLAGLGGPVRGGSMARFANVPEPTCGLAVFALCGLLRRRR